MLDDRTRKVIMDMIERHQRANTASPQAALESLVRDGIYTADGRLTIEYGGKAEIAKKARPRKTVRSKTRL